MWLGWGPDLAFFYNDAYVPTLGVKHPEAIGRPIRQVWPEIYDALEGRFNAVMRDGEATWDQALQLFLERSGYPGGDLPHLFLQPAEGRRAGAVGGLDVRGDRGHRGGDQRNRLPSTPCARSPRALLPVRTRQAGLLEAMRQALRPATAAISPSASCACSTAPRTSRMNPCRRPTGRSLRCCSPADRSGSALRWPSRETAPAGRLGQARHRGSDRSPSPESGQTAPVGALVLGLNPYRPADPDIEGLRRA